MGETDGGIDDRINGGIREGLRDKLPGTLGYSVLAGFFCCSVLVAFDFPPDPVCPVCPSRPVFFFSCYCYLVSHLIYWLSCPGHPLFVVYLGCPGLVLS